ncbi:MAG TPA: head GIN domain-containing protein [Burkholderiaceae bacterium]
MKALAKTGIALAILATVCIGATSTALRAQGLAESTPSNVNRTVTTQSRPITAAVTDIEMSGPFTVVVRPGATASMTIKAEQYLLQRVSTVQDGGKLRIESTDRSNWRNQPVEIQITVPQLTRLIGQGSGDVRASGFSGASLEVGTHGSGNVNMQGQYKKVRAQVHGSGDLSVDGGVSDDVEVSVYGSGDLRAIGKTRTLRTQLRGSGDIDMRGLAAEEVSVDLHGSGDIDLQALKSIAVNLNGSGDVSVKGNPTQRNISKRGSGDVSWN